MSDTDTGRTSPPAAAPTSAEGDAGRSGATAPPPVTHDPARRMNVHEVIAAQRELDGRAPVPTIAPVPVDDETGGVAVTPGVTVDPADVSLTGGGSSQPGRVRVGDRIFSSLASGSGVVIVLLIAAVAAFLVLRAVPALSNDDVDFLTSRSWQVDGTTLRFGIAALLWVTVISSVIAMVLAVPVGVGIALFITHYAPARATGPVARVIDLLAAIPSIVYGVWGLLVFAPAIQPVADFLQTVLGSWFPLFAAGIQFKTIFVAGVVLAIMILPIVTAVSRDVFERTPRANIEASLALGATRWEMIRMAVLPYGKAGVVSGAMLGLGRALGETIAVTLILATVTDSAPFRFTIFDGGSTFASKIALNAGEFSEPKSTGAYIAAGLVLFVLTFIVNAAARAVVSRGAAK